MVSDLDIYRSTTVLIDRHGENAASEAAHRADAFRKRGDQNGYAVWRRIHRAIEELSRMAPAPGERTN